jgi:alanine transaminase
MARIIADARADGLVPRCIVIINPGNPTGTVSSRNELGSLVDLAAKENLMLLSDEGYQVNVLPGHDFVSCKAVVRQAQVTRGSKDVQCTALQLISLHSVSKGMVGEGGQRDGYLEAVGFPPEIQDEVRKLISTCFNLSR